MATKKAPAPDFEGSRDGARCDVVGGVHEGKSGKVADINVRIVK